MSHDDEKPSPDLEHVERGSSPRSGEVVGEVAEEAEFSEAHQKRIMRRIDRRLVVTVGLMYCVSLMDRTNLSAANIAGMTTELSLIDNRYSVVTLLFFVTYTICQPPSTVIVRAIGPRVHLAGITVAWGAVMIGSKPPFLQNCPCAVPLSFPAPRSDGMLSWERDR